MQKTHNNQDPALAIMLASTYEKKFHEWGENGPNAVLVMGMPSDVRPQSFWRAMLGPFLANVEAEALGQPIAAEKAFY